MNDQQAVAVIERMPAAAPMMTAEDILTQVKTVQQVMQAVMKKDIHYGVIQGTDKPTLLKPGAEVLCAVFRIKDSYRIEDLSTEDSIRYRIICTGTHQVSRIEMGEGVGECSSLEKKYKWVKAFQREWDATPDNRRRKSYYWDRKARAEKEVLQVRTDPADFANTVLKMAAKRAKIAMTLNVTAASDIFAQDLEDVDDRLRTMNDEGGDHHDDDPPKLPAEREAALIESLDKAFTDPQTTIPETVDALRAALQKALTEAKDAGDVEAHKRIKAHGVELQQKLAAKVVSSLPVGKSATTAAPPEALTDEQIINKLAGAKTTDDCDAICDAYINGIEDDARRNLLADAWRKRRGELIR